MKTREPPPPSELDEELSLASVESSPWVLERIRELGITGTKLTTWHPPVVSVSREASDD